MWALYSFSRKILFFCNLWHLRCFIFYILKTRNPTRVPGFSEIKTRNPLFQNPVWVPNHYRHVTDIAAFHELKVFAKKFFLLHYLPSSFCCGQKDTTKMASFHQRLFLKSISKIWVQHDLSQCCFWTKNSEKLYT